MVAILVTPFVLFSILREPLVQTFLARTGSAYLSKQLQTKVHIESLTINPLLTIEMRKVQIQDHRKNDLLTSDRIYINLDISKLSPAKKTLKINKLSLLKTVFHLAMYKGDSLMNINHVLESIKSDNPRSDTGQWEIEMERFRMTDGKFTLNDLNIAPTDSGMDFKHLGVYDIRLYLDDISLGGESDTIRFKVDELNAIEKSGFQLNKLKGEFAVSNKGIRAEHLKVITNQSELSMNLEFNYDQYAAFNDFLNDVNLNTVIGKSDLYMHDLGYFAPVLFDMKNTIEISGTFLGPVSSLRGKNMKLGFGHNSYLHGNVFLRGLPDVMETFVDLNINRLNTNKNDIESLQLPGSGQNIKLPENIESMKTIHLSGLFTGFYNDFAANAKIKTSIGKIRTDVTLRHKKQTNEFKYKGHVKATEFDLGKFLDSRKILGKMSMDADIDGQGLTAENVEIVIHGIIDSMIFQQEQFEKININGKLANKKFQGDLMVSDELLNMYFNGVVDFQSETPVFDFYAKVDDANLYELNLLKRDTLMLLSSILKINFRGLELDEMSGRIEIDSTTYKEGDRYYVMDSLLLTISPDTMGLQSVSLKSDYIHADLNGFFQFSKLIPSFKLFNDKYVDALMDEQIPVTDSLKNQHLTFSVDLINSDPLTELFLPNLQLSDHTLLNGVYNFSDNRLDVNANADSVQYGGLKIRDWSLSTAATQKDLTVNTNGRKIIFRESSEVDSVELGLDSVYFTSTFINDSIRFRMGWDDQEDVDWNVADIKGYVNFRKHPEIRAKITSAKIHVNDTNWRINKNNLLIIDSSSVAIRDFDIRSHEQDFSVNGKISYNPSDTLNLKFSNWKVSNFDLIYAGKALDVDGEINGEVSLWDLYHSPHFISNLSIHDMYFNKHELGDFNLFSNWDHQSNALFARAEIVKGAAKADTILKGSGHYFASPERDSLHFDLNLANMQLYPLNPMVRGIFSDIEGLASGQLSIRGKAGNPKLLGSVRIMRGGLRVDYLDVYYTFSHDVQFSEGLISIENMRIYDSIRNSALLNGRLTHKKLTDWQLKLDIEPNDLLVLSTNYNQNKSFYGEAYATGIAEIFGPFDNLKFNVKARSNKGTHIRIPISTETELYENDYIVFVNPSGDTIQSKKPDYDVNLEGLDMNLEVNVTPQAEIELFLPMNMGEIKATGEGNIKIGIDPQGDFQMNGDYVINDGTFLFTLRNLVNRRFQILKGGKISWTGNPYDAEIDVRALYRLKTSLDGLGLQIDTTSSFSQRINVNCIITLKNQLFDPDIKFSIELPNVDDQTRQLVYSVLDTTDNAQMNQQMISLLVLGSFSYKTSGFNASTASAKLISNQLSNLLSQISKDFNVGVNYRPGDQISQEELEVALSTQLFDDRVIIDGNFGVVGDEATRNASNIVGDVNIEVKLTEDGRFRVRAFNRSNINSIYDINTLDDIAPYTQGIGISWRKEFDALFPRKNKTKNQIKPDMQ